MEKLEVNQMESATYTIYQLNGDESNHYYRFTSLRVLEREGLTVRKEGYDAVYSAPMLHPDDSDTHILNQLYEQFNIYHPSDFKGHSLSVSDIVALQRGNVVSYHYVDSYGFKELPDFRVAELSTGTEQSHSLEGSITANRRGLTVDGHVGTWYVVDSTKIDGTDYFLLEHEEYGDEAACIIVDTDSKLVLDEVWNGFEDLEYYFDSDFEP